MELNDLKLLQRLRILQALQEKGTYANAAKALSASQSYVTHEIRALQRTLGVTLVKKRGRKNDLTPQAEELLKATASLANTLKQVPQVVEQLRRGELGKVTIMASATVGSFILPHVLGAFHHAHPNITIDLQFDTRVHAGAHLLNRQVDIVIIQQIRPSDDIQVEKFVPNELIVVAAPDHPLVSQQPVSLATLSQETFIMRQTGSGTRLDTQELFTKQGLPSLHIGLEFPESTAIKRAVQAKLGISILSRHAVQTECYLGRLVELTAEGFPLEDTWLLARRARAGDDAEDYHTDPAKTLWDFLTTYRDEHQLLDERKMQRMRERPQLTPYPDIVV